MSAIGGDAAPVPARPRLAEALAVVTRASVEGWTHAIGCILAGEAHWIVRAHGVAVVMRGWERLRDTVADEFVPPWRIAEPAEAWEALATSGLVPHDAVDEPRRRFEHAARDGGAPRADERWRPHPATVADCVAFAADWDGVLRAEELARLHRGARPSAPSIAWRALPAPSLRVLRQNAERQDRRAVAYRASTPSAPLAELLALGYVPGGTSGDALVLIAPSLGS